MKRMMFSVVVGAGVVAFVSTAHANELRPHPSFANDPIFRQSTVVTSAANHTGAAGTGVHHTPQTGTAAKHGGQSVGRAKEQQ